MGQNRLSASVLMHINLDVNIDAKRALKILCNRVRTLETTNICASMWSFSSFPDSLDLIQSVLSTIQ